MRVICVILELQNSDKPNSPKRLLFDDLVCILRSVSSNKKGLLSDDLDHYGLSQNRWGSLITTVDFGSNRRLKKT